MNTFYSSSRINIQVVVLLRRALPVVAGLLLSGCQWLPQTTDWMPEHWPWQETESPRDQAAVTRQQSIDSLIAKGNLAFTKDRLSIPANDNALMYYREALKLDPDSEEAHEGLQQVSKRFRKLARTAHDNGNGKQARKYLRQAELITGTDNPENRKLRQQLSETPKGQDPRSLDTQFKERYDASQKN